MADFPLPAQSATPAEPARPTPPEGGWAVAAGRGAAWWGSGWRLFVASPWTWIGITVLFFAILFGLAFIPVLGQIASSLIYPILAGGVLLGARELDRGGELRIEHLFACFNAKAAPLLVVALLYYAGWLLIWVCTAAVLVAMLGVSTLTSLISGDPSEAGMALMTAFGMGSLIVLLIAALLGLPLVMADWFAPALVLFRGADPTTALKASFIGCWRNMPPFLIYGLLWIVFAIIASIPLGLGWLVLAPVFGASLYASYKDIFGAPD